MTKMVTRQAGELRGYREIANLYQQRAQWQKALTCLKAAHKILTRNRAQMRGKQSILSVVHTHVLFISGATENVEETEAELLYAIGENELSAGNILEAEESLHKALEASHKLSKPVVFSHRHAATISHWSELF